MANTVLAKGYEISFLEMFKTKIKQQSPQVYLFNENQSLIYAAKRQDDNLLNKFKLKVPLKDSDSVQKDLEFLMKEPAEFNEKGYTLFVILNSKEIGSCPPCKAQMRVINKIQRKLKEKIQVHTLTIMQSTNSPEDLPEGYRPKLIGKPVN